MSTSRLLGISACLLAGLGAGATCAQKRGESPVAAERSLRDAPLTIIFRKVSEDPAPGLPSSRCWSINSAGQGQLTVEFSPTLRQPNPGPRTTREEFKLSPKTMAALRRALRDARFYHLDQPDGYGPIVVHGGWTTLTVAAGDHVKQVRFNALRLWGSRSARDEMAEAAPAVRVWVKVCAALDPDGKVFPERADVAKAVASLNN
jgi:hypothetical protein